MASRNGLRIGVLDIESTSLEGSYGRLLCACWKFNDQDDVVVVRSPSLRAEARALTRIGELWDATDILVTWNGKLFDVPLINARRVIHGMPALRPIMHIDLLYQYKKLRTRGNHLDGAAKDLKTKTQKYEVPASVWQDAQDTGDRALSTAALDEIVHHCKNDVLITEELLGRLKHLLVNITR